MRAVNLPDGLDPAAERDGISLGCSNSKEGAGPAARREGGRGKVVKGFRTLLQVVEREIAEMGGVFRQGQQPARRCVPEEPRAGCLMKYPIFNDLADRKKVVITCQQLALKLYAPNRGGGKNSEAQPQLPERRRLMGPNYTVQISCGFGGGD